MESSSNRPPVKNALLGVGISSMITSPIFGGQAPSSSAGLEDVKSKSQPSADAVTTTESESGSTSLKSSDVGPEQEYLLSELETSDSGSIGLVLRTIYDGGDVHKCLRALEKKIRHYDRDIEKLCSFHYSGFIEAVRELLDLKTECRQLSVDITAVDRYIHENSHTIMEKAEEIVKLRKMQANIASATESVSLCLPVLEKYMKLQEQMEKKKYYAALKTLEQLEHTYLPRIERYRFAQKMMHSIGEIRNTIRDRSFSEFTDFLESLRIVSARIGEVALRHAMEQRHAGGAVTLSRKRLLTSNAVPTVNSEGSKLANAGAGDDTSEDFSAQDMVDFSPVYRCCHIFTVLGAKETFEQYYRKQRRDQASLLLRAPERTRDPLDGFLAYFHEMIGFFVVEDHIMQTAPGLVTRSYRDELWNISVAHAEKTLNNHFGQCTEAAVMLKIKDLIILFALTMKGYGFRVSTLYKVLQNFRDQYNEILMTRCCGEFDGVLRTDNYAAMVIEDENGYRRLCERFPLSRKVAVSASGDPSSTAYPKRLPFSQFVPVVYEQAQQFVRGCLQFMSDLGMSQTDVDDTVRRSTNLLLERFSGHLKRYLAEELKSSSLVQLIQITINMGYLELSCEYLEAFIAKATGAAVAAGHIAKLKQDLFREARSEVEQQIDESMRNKIEGILGLAQYTWDLPESSGRASGYITDLIAFLQTTFVSFTNLPPVLARHICMQSCKYLSSRLLSFLMDSDVKQISSGALEQFNLDVIQCEQFTAQCPVTGLEDGTLAMTFADLRQLLDLFMSSDWTVYLADFGREGGRYIRVHPQTAVRLLEKILENERRKNSLFGKGKDKDKKKLLDTVLKQLKTLAANGATHG